MNRRHAVAGAMALVLSRGGTATAQVAPRATRIGWLTVGDFATWEHREAFTAAMRERGWIEGGNYVVDTVSYAGRIDRLPAAAAELVQRQPDLLVTAGTPAVAALMAATRRIPIVYMGVADPVGSGMAASLGRPGGNATGLGGLGERLFSKNIEVLKQVVPGAQRIGLAYNPDFAIHMAFMPEMDAAAAQLGLQLRKVALRGPDDLAAALATLARERVDAVFLLGQPWQARQAERVAALFLEHRLPAIGLNQELTRAGLLASYAWRSVDEVKRLPHYIDRILKGTPPGELPVEQPTRLVLTLNLRTARALGLAVPQAVLLRADEVIE